MVLAILYDHMQSKVDVIKWVPIEIILIARFLKTFAAVNSGTSKISQRKFQTVSHQIFLSETFRTQCISIVI